MDIISNLPMWSITLMGALIVVLGSFMLKRFELNHTAKTKFRSAFADELSALSELQIVDWSNVFHLLRSAYPKHEAAYREYLHALVWSPIKKRTLNQRWIVYRGEYEYWAGLEYPDGRLAHFVSTSEAEEGEMRKKAIRLINELIA